MKLLWKCPKPERVEVTATHARLQREIENRKDSIQRLQNYIANHEFELKKLQKELEKLLAAYTL